MNSKPRFSSKFPIELLLILIIAAATFLPGLTQARIYRDDWYYTMDRLIGGPGVFQEMFKIDRPARGPLFEAYFQFFGDHPLPYHMISFIWRVLGGFSAWWLFRLLWPRKRSATLLMAILFTLYPGYSRWLEGFENQPTIFSLFLEVLSIALTLQAIRTSRTAPKVLAWLGSILTGWAYIALVDYSIGMEVFRLLCVFVIVSQANPSLPSVKKGVSTLRVWAPAAVIPAGFLLWRLVFFHNERAATNVGLQLGGILNSPVSTGLWWLVHLFQSVFNETVLAWAAPLFEDLFGLGLSGALIGFALGVFVAGVVLVAVIWINKTTDSRIENDGKWQKEAILIGLAGVLFGVLPIVLANRIVAFGAFSHYSIPASLPAAILVTGVVYSIDSQHIKMGLISILALLAAVTHYVVATQVINEENVISNFWHQMVWRAPGIASGTTLFVAYPGINIGEDIDAVAGPANYLYFPEETNQIPVVYHLVALPQMDYTTKDVITSTQIPYDYRTHTGTIDYNKLLVISQPTESSCVHVLDARWPRYTDRDSDQLLILGQYSKIDSVLMDGSGPRPADYIFGPEPAHGWCYYYEKAELALQKQDWAEIVKLGEEAGRQDLHPIDRIEWSPFLQAYAHLGNEQAFKSTSTKIDSSPFVRSQACQFLLNMEALGDKFNEPIQTMLDEKLCRGQSKTRPAEFPTVVPAP